MMAGSCVSFHNIDLIKSYSKSTKCSFPRERELSYVVAVVVKCM
jgi:hypothetical protein